MEPVCTAHVDEPMCGAKLAIINARDAIPHGGPITLTAGSKRVGIGVSDLVPGGVCLPRGRGSERRDERGDLGALPRLSRRR
jgi:hypothetical protein